MLLKRTTIKRSPSTLARSHSASTVFVSLLGSARLHELEPLAYMRDLFCLVPGWPNHRVLELAPAYWKKTLENVETQQKLAANVLRRLDSTACTVLRRKAFGDDV